MTLFDNESLFDSHPSPTAVPPPPAPPVVHHEPVLPVIAAAPALEIAEEPSAVEPSLPEAPPQRALFGTDLFGNALDPRPRNKLAERFVVAPFTILSAREGGWQDRKRAWISIGIQSELGRRPDLIAMKSLLDNAEKYGQYGTLSALSVFDPVLCELAYSWWCPPGGTILDPFSGGSVRGIVAACLGYRYVGIDLSQAQVDANRAQAEAILNSNDPQPTWICGDSNEVLEWEDTPEADLVFSCPPYGDLEEYSKNPKDLSAMSADQFDHVHASIIAKAVKKLKPNRFACWVTGDYRDKNGLYRNFPGKTVQAFLDAGCSLYNEAILVTALGTLPVRTSAQFDRSRKLGKSHQNITVTVKGDWRRAADACASQRTLL